MQACTRYLCLTLDSERYLVRYLLEKEGRGGCCDLSFTARAHHGSGKAEIREGTRTMSRSGPRISCAAEGGPDVM